MDVETAGPIPRQYSLLSIGACTLYEPQATFYIELQPLTDQVWGNALTVSDLNLADLHRKGTAPPEAMQRFSDWVEEVIPAGGEPIFLAFNAPFDWMFVSDYFFRFLGRNPCGHKALEYHYNSHTHYFTHFSLAAYACLLSLKGDPLRGIEINSMLVQQNFVRSSRWFNDLYRKPIYHAAMEKQPGEIKQAEEIGKEMNLWRTLAQIIQQRKV